MEQKDSDLWLTIPKFFKLGYEYRDESSYQIWQDFRNNILNWYCWTSATEEGSYIKMADMVEFFINNHAAIDVNGNRVYTSLPSATFLYAESRIDGLIVRGAAWSNGGFWEEVEMNGKRDLFLAMDKTTMNAFNYTSPDVEHNSSITSLMDTWEKSTAEETANENPNDKSIKSTTPN